MNYIPCIEVESANGIREVSLNTRHLMNRRLFLQGSITSETADIFLSEFLFLEEEPEREVELYINSPGGEITAGLVIYDLIQSTKMPINMYCTGIAASMAAIILAGGKKGRRFILPHSKTMIHEPLIDGGVGGSASSIKNISDSILETRKIVNEILSKHTGKSIKEINKATSFDNYMNAEETVKFGICDEVKRELGGLDDKK